MEAAARYDGKYFDDRTMYEVIAADRNSGIESCPFAPPSRLFNRPRLGTPLFPLGGYRFHPELLVQLRQWLAAIPNGPPGL